MVNKNKSWVVDFGMGGENTKEAWRELEGALFPSMKELGALTGTDKVTHHGYHRFYEKWFGGMRGRNLKLLEIGLARGSSMNMWCGYFPAAEIYGIDITLDERCQPCRLGQGIFVFSGDSGDPGFLGGLRKGIGGKVQIIVDDGAHTPESQLAAFNYLFTDVLEGGGVYAIEDIETSYWTRGSLYGNEYEGGGVGRRGGKNVVEVFKGLADIVNREFWTGSFSHVEGLSDEACKQVESVEFGHNLIVIKKRVDGAGEGAYLDRIYRMRDNVEGYV